MKVHDSAAVVFILAALLAAGISLHGARRRERDQSHCRIGHANNVRHRGRRSAQGRQGGGKITLRHGELKGLEMPPMTMVFQVKDPAMLDRVKPGDKVRFTVQNTGGTLVITEIEVGK